MRGNFELHGHHFGILLVDRIMGSIYVRLLHDEAAAKQVLQRVISAERVSRTPYLKSSTPTQRMVDFICSDCNREVAMREVPLDQIRVSLG